MAIAADVRRLLASLNAPELREPDPPPERLACGALAWVVVGREAGAVYCAGGTHARQREDGLTESAGPCPIAAREEVRARIAKERERLAGKLERLRREGGEGWVGYDTSEPTARQAFDLMQRFAAGRPPDLGVYLRGGCGLGKTRLFLASYFELLGAGVNARYTTPPELRDAFRAATDDDPGVRFPAQGLLENVRRADVVFLDDVGTAGDERFIGDFREGLWKLLERSRAVFAVSTNLTSEELLANPDVGPQNLSRLVGGSEVLVMQGEDWRTRRARRR